ncbi:lysE type translocator family protein [Burkholderia thailandensis MSMB121]|nr:lysE type translocator family protein [Burkholderia thailandensis MSMB121]
MTAATWLAFAGASIVLLMIPGPTILLVIGDSLANRNRSSWSTVAGVAAGDTTAMTISLAGAGALLAMSAAAFTALKLVGGGYLIYLGIRSILHARRVGATEVSVERRSAKRRFLSAWAVTALNPKSIVFFVAFVPQFISPHETFARQCAVLLPTFVCLASINAACYARIARFAAARLTGAAALRLRRRRRADRRGRVDARDVAKLTLRMWRAVRSRISAERQPRSSAAVRSPGGCASRAANARSRASTPSSGASPCTREMKRRIEFVSYSV